MSYLQSSANSTWLDNCYEADGPFYQCTLSLLVVPPSQWNIFRLTHLRRLIILAQQRYISPSLSTKNLTDITVKDYSVYKSVFIFFGLVDCIYNTFFKVN